VHSDALQARLGHVFQDQALLELALTHRSVGGRNNERLEFLGDAVLGYVVGELLFNERPNDQEDMLTLMRARLVRKETLARVAAELELGRHIRLGASAASSGGHRRASILADALEAVLGAVHQDGGLEAARAVITRLWRESIDTLEPDTLKDAKTMLQEWLQGRALPLPDYEVVRTEGAEHQKIYEVHCRVVCETEAAVGIDRSRKLAEKAAAAAMLERLT
jgi:ribonuclease-3